MSDIRYTLTNENFGSKARLRFCVFEEFGTLVEAQVRLTQLLSLLSRDELPIMETPVEAPVSTGEEVTLHEEIPQEPAPAPEKTRKNAWVPEEDDVVRDSETPEVAMRRYEVSFPAKRTPAAIQARWYKLRPYDERLQKIHDEIEAVKPTPEMPERGATVRVITDIGRMPAGNTGKVIRRDERIGEVLVDLGPKNGCHWLSAEKVEVVTE
jgi:hypothetical protein